MSKLKHRRTCVYNVNYHIVWSTKYRRKVLNAKIEKLLKDIPSLKCHEYFNKHEDIKKLVNDLRKEDKPGVHAFYNENIFEAVYSMMAHMNVPN